jgi:hypothetical protein
VVTAARHRVHLPAVLDLGVSPHIAKDVADQSDIELTMTIYARTAHDEKRKALKKFGRRTRLTLSSKKTPGLMAPGPFGCSDAVGKGGVEPPTFRFSEVTSPLLTVPEPRSDGGRRVPM